MRIFTLDFVFTLPREFGTSTRVPTDLDNRNAALLKPFDLSVNNFNRFLNKVQSFVDLDFFQGNSKSFI